MSHWHYFLFFLVLSDKVEVTSSSAPSSSTATATLTLANLSSSTHSPPIIIDETAQTQSTDSSCASSSDTATKKRKRRRKRKRKSSPVLNDANETSSEVLSPAKVHYAPMDTTATGESSLEEEEEGGKQDGLIIGEESLHSSMPAHFAVRRSLMDASNRRKKRRRRRRRRRTPTTRRTSVSASVLFARSSSSSSSSTLASASTYTTTSSSTRVESTVEKYDNADVEGNTTVVSTPEFVSTFVETNISSSRNRKRTRTKANRTIIVAGRGSDSLGRKKSRSNRGGSGAAAGGKDGECLRRIKREWKDAVKMGIAYDWMNMRTIDNQRGNSTSSSNNNNNNSSSNDKNRDHNNIIIGHNNYIRIGPYGKNLLRWHFSVAGPVNSVYAHGIYHGAILLPRDYPASPPRVRLLTPSGRFIVDADICLTASNYHPESWTPRWTVVSLVQALRVHMLTSPAEIGGMHASDEMRRGYAMESREWRSRDGIVDHGKMVALGVFPPPPVHDLDGSMAPTVEIGLGNKNALLPTINDDDDNAEQERQQEGDEAIFESVTLRRSLSSSSSSMGTNVLDNIIYTSEKETFESVKSSTSVVQLNTKSSSTQLVVQYDRHIRSNQFVRSEANENAETTITETKSSENIKSKRRRRKEASKTRRDKKSSKASPIGKQRGVLAVVLTRIFVEMLKLPIRMLSTLLKLIGKLLGRVWN